MFGIGKSIKRFFRLCRLENIRIAIKIIRLYNLHTLKQTIIDILNSKLPYSKLAFEIYSRNNIHPNDFLIAYSVNNIDDINDAVNSYLSDGKDSADMLKKLCSEHLTDARLPISLLEFASGYGRVTRNLDKSFFDVTACDIHSEAVKFIKKKFKTKALLSTTNPNDFNLKHTYDVVFALSFFSHMPDRTFGSWLKALYKHVKPGGAFVFTTHGRLANEQQNWTLNDGYAFEPVSEQADLDYSEYGITITERSYVEKTCERFLSVKPSLFIEGFWWNTQDLYIIFK